MATILYQIDRMEYLVRAINLKAALVKIRQCLQ